jgi:hypothetical protein
MLDTRALRVRMFLVSTRLSYSSNSSRAVNCGQQHAAWRGLNVVIAIAKAQCCTHNTSPCPPTR